MGNITGNDDLGTRLLASVSRSFYLTLRFLPAKLRAPVSVAYLLARASDTVADNVEISLEERVELLCQFRKTKPPEAWFARLGGEIAGRCQDLREGELLGRIREVVAWRDVLALDDKESIARVIDLITSGQELDAQRFIDPSKVVALPDAGALDEYTYLVAGCVGEFWTDRCFAKLKNPSRLEVEEMRRLGCAYGKGLQLVNILRDLPEDLAAGRCYLPRVELEEAGVDFTIPITGQDAALEVVGTWIEKARGHLSKGATYVKNLRSPRLRYATVLPLMIGFVTLERLGEAGWRELQDKVKISRGDIKKILVLALAVAVSDRPLSRYENL